VYYYVSRSSVNSQLDPYRSTTGGLTWTTLGYNSDKIPTKPESSKCICLRLHHNRTDSIYLSSHFIHVVIYIIFIYIIYYLSSPLLLFPFCVLVAYQKNMELMQGQGASCLMIVVDSSDSSRNTIYIKSYLPSA
jgi:hypothetical protein